MKVSAAEAASPEAGRARLIAGMGAAVADKGYGATTIADVVRHARVSKRTFYEHFGDKEACFLAAYRTAGEETLRAIAAAVDPAAAWEEQIDAAARAYLRVLEENAALTRAFLLEIHAAGAPALRLRREIHQRFADLLRGLVQAARKKHPHLHPLSASMATALVGGINELVLVSLEKGGAGTLRELGNTAAELVRAVLLAPPTREAPREPLTVRGRRG
jgi:AcrR family transcriptional regulator